MKLVGGIVFVACFIVAKSVRRAEPDVLPEDELPDLEDVFLQYDANNDGKVSIDELQGVMENVGVYQSTAELENDMAEADYDDDGYISFAEFLAVIATEEYFDNFDDDEDGSLNAAELIDMLEDIKFKVSDPDQLLLWEFADEDEDGGVDFDEFQRTLKAAAA